MAAVEVTISGVLYDKLMRTTRPVVLIGEASLTGLSVGGGPMPGSPGAPSHPIAEPPPGIWGGPPLYPDIGGPGPQPGPGHPSHPIYYPPTPTHPIVLPPVEPGGPPVIWPSPGHPSHPIVLPEPPPPPEGNKPPPAEGGWGYSSEYGWGFFPMGQSPGPKV
jgi:hypothetical protein